MKRRDIIVSMGVGTTLLTGCAGGNSTSDSSSDSSTSEETPTPEPDSGVIQHELNESFIIGTGSNKIEYNVRNIYTHNVVGSSNLNEEANGRFVTPIVEITSRANETITISSDHIIVQREDEAEYEADSAATTYLSNDDRFDAEPILLEELQPDVSVTGGLVFEVAPDYNYALVFEPTGILSGEQIHYISIGSV